jgi:hypothetical protein
MHGTNGTAPTCTTAHQLIPVMSRFHGDPLHRGQIPLGDREDQRAVIIKSPLGQHRFCSITDNHHTVLSMKIDPHITSHPALLGVGGDASPRLARRRLYPPHEEPSRRLSGFHPIGDLSIQIHLTCYFTPAITKSLRRYAISRLSWPSELLDMSNKISSPYWTMTQPNQNGMVRLRPLSDCPGELSYYFRAPTPQRQGRDSQHWRLQKF